MASAFIGMPVFVTLNGPQPSTLQGTVANVIPETSTLMLHDVMFLSTGERRPTYTVDGTRIADISIQGSSSLPERPVQNPPPQPVPYTNQSAYPASYATVHQSAYPLQTSLPPRPGDQTGDPTPTQAKPNFVDPAILSVGKKPRATPPAPTAPAEFPSTPIKPHKAASSSVPVAAAATAPSRPGNVGQGDQNVKRAAAGKGTKGAKTGKGDVGATLSAPFSSALGSAGEALDDSHSGNDEPSARKEQRGAGAQEENASGSVRRASINRTRTGKLMDQPEKPGADGGKKSRRGNKKKKDPWSSALNGTDFASSPEVTKKIGESDGVSPANGTNRAKGWRQTPILQDTTSARTTGAATGKTGETAASGKKGRRRRQKGAADVQNGWATEDATDIQELPDFNFEENLSKFDKRSVFDAIRNEDTTADEDRLVSYNRPARPGTYGGKNLHPSENVLEGTRASRSLRRRESSSDTTESSMEFDSGRNSRRALSRASLKRMPYRQNSGTTHIDEGSGSVPSRSARASIARPNVYQGGSPINSRGSPTGSPSISQSHVQPLGLPHHPSALSHHSHSNVLDATSGLSSTSRKQPHLRLATTNRPCPTLTPGTAAAIEELAEVELGLSSDILAENAGRGIAEVALQAINPGGRRLARENLLLNARPVVVVLAGNHRAGARALAAARHLAGRGVRMLVFLVGSSRTAESADSDVRRQADLFRRQGGSVRGWADVRSELRRADAPPELIVDALLDPARGLEALGQEDRDEAWDAVGWANKSAAAVLAVDTPSGVNGSTGEIAIREGEPLEVRARFVVGCGAVRTGVLKAKVHAAASAAADTATAAARHGQMGGSGAAMAQQAANWLLWVVDIGISKAWKRRGIAGGKRVRFGAEWVAPVAFVGDGGEEGAR
ncbi:YjeF-related protein N-terminus-domain-containing protein [Lineolata rhizophorae]|uniref:Enhancer of mRNA-decapping protein 3 n=1 Tax=Lineolata rhizophorae TaxID=578093 RepID=A0A6A6PDW5_9PEZI|nr:YjeF-related protein N-terminus-domain-containing protein [Lineolata rhizophorae]